MRIFLRLLLNYSLLLLLLHKNALNTCTFRALLACESFATHTNTQYSTVHHITSHHSTAQQCTTRRTLYVFYIWKGLLYFRRKNEWFDHFMLLTTIKRLAFSLSISFYLLFFLYPHCKCHEYGPNAMPNSLECATALLILLFTCMVNMCHRTKNTDKLLTEIDQRNPLPISYNICMQPYYWKETDMICQWPVLIREGQVARSILTINIDHLIKMNDIEMIWNQNNQQTGTI